MHRDNEIVHFKVEKKKTTRFQWHFICWNGIYKTQNIRPSLAEMEKCVRDVGPFERIELELMTIATYFIVRIHIENAMRILVYIIHSGQCKPNPMRTIVIYWLFCTFKGLLFWIYTKYNNQADENVNVTFNLAQRTKRWLQHKRIASHSKGITVSFMVRYITDSTMYEQQSYDCKQSSDMEKNDIKIEKHFTLYILS